MNISQFPDHLEAGFEVNISDFGCVPNDPSFDNGPLIQEAIDYCILISTTQDGKSILATGLTNRQPIVVHIPAGIFYVRTPVYAEDFVEIRGINDAVSVIAAADYIIPVVVGMRRRQAWRRDVDWLKTIPNVFAADHRMDLFGKVDTSLASAPNQKWGITTRSPSSGSPRPDHYVCVWGFPPMTGRDDGWETVNVFTIDFKIDGTVKGPLFGMGTSGSNGPEPWWIETYFEPSLNKETFRFSFMTAEKPLLGAAPPRQFTFGDAKQCIGPTDITVQVNLTTAGAAGTCHVRAWIGGQEQVVIPWYGCRLITATSTEPSFVPSDQLTFRRNKGAAFHIGVRDSMDNRWGEDDVRGDFSLYGLWMGDSAYYTSDKNGRQVRQDGGVLNDAYRYNDGDSRQGRICRLSLDTPPTSDSLGRLVDFVGGVRNGGVTARGWFVAQDSVGGAMGGVRFRDVQIRSMAWGIGVLVYQSINVDFINCTIVGGWAGIWGARCGAVYDVNMRDCTLFGNDCWFYGHSQVVKGENFRRSFIGATAFRFDGGCDVWMRNVSAGSTTGQAPGSMVEILAGGYASGYVFENFESDDEGGQSHVGLLCEMHPQGVSIIARNFSHSMRDGKVPLIKLTDAMPENDPNIFGFIEVDNHATQNGPVVEAEGRWKGVVRNAIESNVFVINHGDAKVQTTV